MFIGSSVEGKLVAETIQEDLDYEVASTVWHQGVFGLSGGTLETLVACFDDYDFATLVLTADDLVEKLVMDPAVRRGVSGMGAEGSGARPASPGRAIAASWQTSGCRSSWRAITGA